MSHTDTRGLFLAAEKSPHPLTHKGLLLTHTQPWETHLKAVCATLWSRQRRGVKTIPYITVKDLINHMCPMATICFKPNITNCNKTHKK